MATQVVKADLDFESVSRILNLPDGTSDQQPATVAQLKAAIEGLAWKDSVRVAAQSNINLASPGGTIDGVNMVAGDRVLVPIQTSGPENGGYVWNGAATPMTRSADMSTAAELEQAVLTVEEGTSANASFRQTAVNFALGTDAVTWTSFGSSIGAASETLAGKAEIATQTETDTGTDDARIVTPLKLATWAGRKLKYSAAFGDGSATSYTITHNLGTRDVHVIVREDAGSYRQVICEVQITSTNAVTLVFSAAPTTNALRAIVIG